MNIFEVIKAIYKKEQLILDKIDIGLCIALTNILRLDKNNLIYLKDIINYLFYIDPKRYLMLLYCVIPYNNYAPFLKGSKKKEELKEDKLYNKIAYVLNWGSKELERQKHILDKVINREDWAKSLGVKL